MLGLTDFLWRGSLLRFRQVSLCEGVDLLKLPLERLAVPLCGVGMPNRIEVVGELVADKSE